MSERYDKEEVKRRMPMLELMRHEGIECRRDGAKHKARCPFHDERSGSFTIYSYTDASEDHANCFGCGWNGDIIKYWMENRGVGFGDALRDLASLASVSPELPNPGKKQAARVPRVMEVTRTKRQKPALPAMRQLRGGELGDLARLRKLSLEGISAAAAAGRVGACVWPQFERCAVHGWECRRDRKDCRGDGHWHAPKDSPLCWVVTDSQRAVAQFRRLDGLPFVRADKTEFKSWTVGSPTWPIGTSEIGDRGGVLMVEGGADMLAAFHFLVKFERLHQVAVSCVLGSSCSICDEALPFFARKRVRIMMDDDEWKVLKTAKGERKIKPGQEAAARWTAQLTDVGAAVETFSLAGLLKQDGSKVKDLNDLAEVDEGAWCDPELREAFFDFDF